MVKFRRYFLTLMLGLLLFCFVFSREAYAYLDPGSGSYIFQLILGSILGMGFTIKIYFKQIKDFFKSRKKKDNL